MITELNGLIKKKEHQKIFIDLNGITVMCHMAKNSLVNENSVASLLIRFIWNSETGPSLYSFLQEEDRNFFDLLINCNGVGPKYALNILDHYSLDVLITIIKEQNAKMLSEVSGIGKKKAELIILELKDKIDSFKMSSSFIGASSNANELITIFKQLGYAQQEINLLIDLYKKDTSIQSLETGEALKVLLSKTL